MIKIRVLQTVKTFDTFNSAGELVAKKKFLVGLLSESVTKHLL